MPHFVYYSSWLLDSNWPSDDVNNDETMLFVVVDRLDDYQLTQNFQTFIIMSVITR